MISYRVDQATFRLIKLLAKLRFIDLVHGSVYDEDGKVRILMTARTRDEQ